MVVDLPRQLFDTLIGEWYVLRKLINLSLSQPQRFACREVRCSVLHVNVLKNVEM